MNPLFVITALVSAGMYLSRGLITKNAAEKLKFNFRDVVLDSFGLTKTRLYVRFEIENPTDTPLRIQDYKLQMLYKNTPIADILIGEHKKILPANNITLFTVPVTLDNITTGKQIYLALVKQEPLQNAVIKGTLKINDFTTQINEEIPLRV